MQTFAHTGESSLGYHDPWALDLPQSLAWASHTALMCSKLLAWLWKLSLYGLRSPRGQTGFQKFEGASLLKCLHYFLFTAAEANCTHCFLLGRLNSSPSLLGLSTHHFLLIPPVVSFLCHIWLWPSKSSLLLRVCLLAFLSTLRNPVAFLRQGNI